jgi:hypothetical protein
VIDIFNTFLIFFSIDKISLYIAPIKIYKTMRTLFLTLVCLLICTGLATGQYYYIPASINPKGNPGGLNNDNEEPFGNGLPAGWSVIDPLDNSPAWSAVQNIPFNFSFNGAPVTQYKVSNTGILTFTTTTTSVPGTNNNTLPDALIPDKSVCVWGIAFSGTMSNDRIVSKTFGTAPNRQHWVQFNTYNHPSSNMQYTYIYYSIVLEESTNNIYVVGQRSNDKGAQPTLTVGVQINSTTASMVVGSPNLGSVSGTSKTPVDNRYYTFIHGVAPTRDVGVSWLQTGNYLILNSAPYKLQGKVKNYTSNMVNSYDINYSVNGGPAVTVHQTGAAHQIPGHGEEWFIHDSLWNPPGVGIYHLRIWATNINGGNDQNNSNDTLHRFIDVSTVFTPKFPLFEMFTSSTCLVCKDANDNLKSVLDHYPGEYAVIKYPMNHPDAGDPYYTAECGIRATYYGVDSLPDMFVHGDVVVDPLYIDTIQFNDLWAKSFMMFNPTHTRSGNTINVSASILPFENFTQGSLVVRFAVVESVTQNHVGTNGETIFYHTFKKFIPDATGVNLGQLQQAVFKTISRTYTFPTPNTIENWNNIKVVVFVQDETTKKVFQAAYSQLASSIDDQELPKGIVSLAPNPANGHTTVHFLMNEPGEASVELIGMNGQVISNQSFRNLSNGVHQYDLFTENLRAGIYLVKLNNGTTTETKRLMVQ